MWGPPTAWEEPPISSTLRQIGKAPSRQRVPRMPQDCRKSHSPPSTASLSRTIPADLSPEGQPRGQPRWHGLACSCLLPTCPPRPGSVCPSVSASQVSTTMTPSCRAQRQQDIISSSRGPPGLWGGAEAPTDLGGHREGRHLPGDHGVQAPHHAALTLGLLTPEETLFSSPVPSENAQSHRQRKPCGWWGGQGRTGPQPEVGVPLRSGVWPPENEGRGHPAEMASFKPRGVPQAAV